MQQVTHKAAHRGHGGRQGNGNITTARFVSYPHYTQKVPGTQQALARPLMRVALWLGEIGARLAGVALRWEIGA